jgi:hypothetical protein
MSRKSRKKKDAKKKPKYHICPYVRAGCEQCPHAVPHLVVPYQGELACSGNCEHHDMHTHCVRTRKRPKNDL